MFAICPSFSSSMHRTSADKDQHWKEPLAFPEVKVSDFELMILLVRKYGREGSLLTGRIYQLLIFTNCLPKLPPLNILIKAVAEFSSPSVMVSRYCNWPELSHPAISSKA